MISKNLNFYLILGIVILSGAVFVINYSAADSKISAEDGTIAYRSTTGLDGNSSPKIRTFSNSGGGSFGNEIELPDSGSPIQYMILKYSPISSKILLVTQSNDDKLDAYVCAVACGNSTSWTVTNDIGYIGIDNNDRRFDVAFEKTTGDALVVYGVSDNNTTHDIAFKVLPDSFTSFTAIPERYINDPHTNDINYSWIELDSNSTIGGNKIVLEGYDTTNHQSNAWIWDGSTWGNRNTIATSVTATSNDEAFAARWTSNGSLAMVMSGQGTTGNINSATWDGISWTNQTSFDVNPSNAADLRWISLKADPTSNKLQAALEYSGSGLDTAYWDGIVWSVTVAIDTSVDSIANRASDFAWHPTGSNGMLFWDTDGSGTTLSTLFCDPECNNNILTNSSFAATGRWLTLFSNPVPTNQIQILGFRLDSQSDIGAFHWDGVGSGDLQNYGDSAMTASTGTTATQAYDFDFRHTPKIVYLTESLNITMSLTSVTNSSGNNAGQPGNNMNNGGDTGDRTPPSFTGAMFSDSENPLTINGKGISLPLYSNPIETKILTTGSEVHVSVLLYDNSGPSNIQHVGLFTDLNGQKKEKSDSDTYILYEKDQPLQINDPNHFFSDAKALASTVGNKLQLDFVITFAKPMEKSDIILDVWDYKRNDQQTKIIGAWKIMENQTKPDQPQNYSNLYTESNVTNFIDDGQKLEQKTQGKLISAIYRWGGYSSQSISDEELLKEMGFKGIHIPKWVMKTTRWVVDGEITIEDFVKEISFLLKDGIIR